MNAMKKQKAFRRAISIVLACLLLCVLLFLVIQRIQFEIIEPASVTIEDNIETIVQLHEKIWNTLDSDARLSVLQRIADIEASYLGLSKRLTVVMKVMPDNKVATYNDDDCRITINSVYVESSDARRALSGLLHEARHSAQYRIAEVYTSARPAQKKLLYFADAGQIAYELENYVDAETNELSYYYQLIEYDARLYAEGRIHIYESFIPAM